MDFSNSYRPQRPAGKAISIEEAWSQQQDSRSPMDAEESPLEVPRLLKMPGEMLHLICHHMDVDNFFVFLHTCKSFFTIGQYRPLLLRQIGRIPGLRLGLEELDGLLDEFLLRARKNCLAAGIFAEMTLHTVFHHVPSLAKAVVSPIARDRLATLDGAGNILVLKLRKQSIELEFKLWPSDCNLNVKNYDVVRIAFTSDGHIAALYRPQPGVLTKDFKSGNDDVEAYDFAMTLVVFDLHFNGDRVRYAPDVVQHRRDFLCYKSEDPIGFSMDGQSISCIARSNSFSRGRTVMRVYHIGLKPRTTCGPFSPEQTCRFPLESVGEAATKTPRASQCGVESSFVDNYKTLIIFAPGEPVHRWWTSVRDLPAWPGRSTSIPRIENNKSEIDIEKNGNTSEFHVGMPFHRCHVSSLTEPDEPELLCREGYLAIGVCIVDAKPRAFIVKSEDTIFARLCHHPRRCSRFHQWSEWQVVALLVGWRQGSSSIGTVMSISTGGSKIAAATWSQVLIWSLNPEMLQQGEWELYFPRRDYNGRTKIGRIRPILLRCPGVVYKLTWIDEFTLYAATDHGLVRWNLDSRNHGQRRNVVLKDFEVPGT